MGAPFRANRVVSRLSVVQVPFPFRRNHRFYGTGQAAAFAAAAVFFLTICLSPGFSGTARAQGRPSTLSQGVAVLPFTNITGDPADDWIGAGIAETMSAGLRGVDGLSIIGRESVLDALHTEMDLASSDTIEPTALELARRIGATWIVGGGYQRAGDLLRVTARVVNVSTGAIVQAVRLDGRTDDIFGLQDRLVDALRPALTTVLASAPPPAPARPVATPNARTASDAIMTSPPEAPPVSARQSAAAPAATTPPLSSNTSPASSPVAAAAAIADTGALASLADAAAITAAFGGPPPPMAPLVMNRDERGGATVRAVRINGSIELDGRLDEEIYGLVPAIDGFLQQEPIEGAPTTEPTEAWIFFDDETLYVSARCYVSEPERMVVTELRRDMINISQNENFVVIFDTFLDRRNGIYFQTTPAGAVRDQLSTDEGSPNESWNTVWDVKTSRFDGGWTLEMAIPFKSLRYRSAGPQVWGLQFRRTIRHKNEQTYLTRVPAAYSLGGIYRLSVAATLVGLETPASSMNLEIKPYVSSSLTTDLGAVNPFSDKFNKNWGVDFKYGLTRSLTADFTYNTDFAQVEEDVQQVNLTRFSLFFPEKREFFLEGQGIFNFGGVQTGGGGGNSDVPVMFFSRRIGLSQGQAIPIIAGGRLTGKVGPVGIGVINVQTDEKPDAGALSTNFSVVRLKSDILRRSTIGVIA
ncbi:MAG: DUF5916 domain-containing protein, partial [Vicinamibacterales bacterium]